MKELVKKFFKYDIRVIAENNHLKIKILHVKINVKMISVSNKEGKELHENIRLMFIASFRFMT